VRAKDRDNRTRGKPGSHESSNNYNNRISGDHDGISGDDNRISCRGFAYPVNPGFLFSRSLLPKSPGRRLLLYRCASVFGGANSARPGLASQSSALQHSSAYGRESTTHMKRVSSLSFPKQRRLTRTSEYERVKRDGLVGRGKLLMLSTVAVENSGLSRVGFITSRRLGSAVARNRVRRRLREIFRRHQRDLRQDFWIVIVARRDAATASYRALEDEWLRLARRASILL
jgi:ribonuclease P protein component